MMATAALPQPNYLHGLPVEQPNSLTPVDLGILRRLGIPPELLTRARVQRVTDQEAREYGIAGSVTGDMSGMLFPYFDPATGRRVTARLRRDRPEVENGKAKNKYISAYADRRHLYFVTGCVDLLRDDGVPIVLVEAEKSALALTAWAERSGWKIVPVAMGGCWGWRGRIGKALAPNGGPVDELGPLSDLLYVNRRKVYVLLDANVSSNSSVQKAQVALISELKKRDCEVLLCRLPATDGINGPDDHIAVYGDDGMAKVLNDAQPVVARCDYGGGRFELTDKGVSYIGPDDKDGNPKPPLWICASLHMVAMTRDSKSGEWGRLLEWRDADHCLHRWAMPLELLQRDGGVEVRCELVRQGLAIAPGRGARELLATYLQMWPIDARARCVERLGWHGPLYVLPGEAIGNAGEQVVFQNAHAIEPGFSVAGTVDEWRDNVAALAQGNSRMMFAVCVALAGALLEPTGEDSGGFHLRGASSTGKSTALKLGASVWGTPTSYCRTWRATSNGLEGLAALHNDGLLILDELSQIDPKEAGEAAYLLANGKGKARATRNGTARPLSTWRLLFFSAGEESLSALMARAGRHATAGQEIRLAEIDADAGAGMGALEVLHGYESPTALAVALKDAASTYHGAVGTQWLRSLVTDRGQLPAVLADGIRRFTEEFSPTNCGGQIERVARRFGLAAMAGEIATRYGLTGWSEGEAITAVGKCFKSWLALFGGAGNREERTLLTQVRAFIEKNGSSRFQRLDNDTQQIRDRAGFIRDADDGTTEYLVLPETFRSEVCSGIDYRYAIKVLQNHGWLAPGHGDRSTQRLKKAPGMKSPWVYVLTSKMWDEGSAE